MEKYKLLENGAYDTELNRTIPNDGGNRDWQEYLVWVSEGNTADPQYTQEELDDNAWSALRVERNALLSATDFMMTFDFYNNKMTAQEQSAVETYRESLRNLPSNTVDPNNITWPTKPQIVIDSEA